MKHRIRAVAIIIAQQKILLVKHVHPTTGYAWWVPPGGGVEEKDKSVIDCASRETLEETGYNVQVSDKLIFVREFFDNENNTLNLELFFRANIIGGKLTISNIHGNGPDEDYIKDAQWISKKQILEIDVFPEELKKDFGLGINNVYLGRQS